MKTILPAFALGLTLLAGPAFAHDFTLGDLVIDHPYARATPPNAPVSGGYMTIRNSGTQADRLVSATASFADKVEFHEMAMDGDVMKMRPLADGLEIPAGGEVILKPGGYHVMFMQLGQQLEAGEKVKATLTFQNAGAIEVEFDVEEMKPGGAGGHDGHSGHGG